ncbi:MAG: class I SAM-dependent methyltransferase [Ignavibacteriae bacterium]|nr:class I SAM-dependent methyltransferase [Ignavibacteriota bacterium]
MIFQYEQAETLIEQTITQIGKSPLTPSVIDSLRKLFPDTPYEIIYEAIDIAQGTIHARQSGKFSEKYSDWLFTKQTFEQSTSDIIAANHASKFENCESVLELCTGSGIDTFALASTQKAVTTIESDKDIAALAGRNFHLKENTTITLLEGKAEDIVPQLLTKTKFEGIWADPSRRTSEGKRKSLSAKDYQPDLNWIMNISHNGIMGIKISPALTLEQLPDGWVREWIGYKNECREQILWKNTGICEGTVSLVDKNAIWRPMHKKVSPFDILISLNDAQFLVEPNSCLIRCGYLAEFYQNSNIGLFDHRIGYGISNKQPPDSPFLSTFEIIECLPFNYKLLQKRITELGWDKETEIKKRGFPELPDEVRRKLRFSAGDGRGVIILSQHEKQKIVFLAKRVK